MQNLKSNDLVAMMWDFVGPAKNETARHHKRHLKEFVDIKSYEPECIEIHYQETKCTVSLVLPWVIVQELKPILKPHRGQIWTKKD